MLGQAATRREQEVRNRIAIVADGFEQVITRERFCAAAHIGNHEIVGLALERLERCDGADHLIDDEAHFGQRLDFVNVVARIIIRPQDRLAQQLVGDLGHESSIDDVAQRLDINDGGRGALPRMTDRLGACFAGARCTARCHHRFLGEREVHAESLELRDAAALPRHQQHQQRHQPAEHIDDRAGRVQSV